MLAQTEHLIADVIRDVKATLTDMIVVYSPVSESLESLESLLSESEELLLLALSRLAGAEDVLALADDVLVVECSD